jgi:putative oxidoreductase
MSRLAPLLIRVVLGVIFFAHGAQKVLGWWGGSGFAATLKMFTDQGIPAPLAILIMGGELFGGLGLIVGCLTRLAAAGVAAIMLGALLLVHLQYGFFMNWFNEPNRGHGIETVLAYLTMAVSIVLTGPGMLAVDGAFTRRRAR